ncbi:MAG: sulfatase [Saprospiraceae bacterium]|nr:sulfatase [Saprospiraceae bacterium]
MKKLTLLLLLSMANYISSGQVTGKKPNIIFFFVDDMGWQETSVPFHTEITHLNKRYHTPNMELLAAKGMKFTQAYACAVCSPSRISLMTGLNTMRHQVTNWTLRRDKSPDPEHPDLLPPKWNLNGMSAEPGIAHTVHAKTLPMFLQEAGYRTIHVGKAHFGATETPGEDPLNLGFDINIAGHAAGGPGSYYASNNFSAAFRDGDRIWDIPGLEKYHGTNIYLTEALTIEANQAMRQAVSDEVPFYLYVSHYAIHAPWEKDFRFYNKYKSMGLTDFQASYASMVESMDKSLGDIMQNVKLLGIESNTIIVFMSDNGQPKQADENLPLRGHKLQAYEGGVRVPLIVYWPGVTRSETHTDDYVIIEDIFPSFLEMAGIKSFQQIGGEIDGVSFLPMLQGQPGSQTDRPLYWHFPNTYDQPAYSSVRQGDWKLIYYHADRRLELFNIAEDIGEVNDRSQENMEVKDALAKILSNSLRETNAPMPIDKRSGKPVEYPDQL